MGNIGCVVCDRDSPEFTEGGGRQSRALYFSISQSVCSLYVSELTRAALQSALFYRPYHRHRAEAEGERERERWTRRLPTLLTASLETRATTFDTDHKPTSR